MSRPPTEDELVGRARGGDADAFAALVSEHEEIAFRTAYLITRNAADAEDAAQTGLVKAWRALPRFRPGSPVRPWLLAIVANEARNRRRAEGRREGLALRAARLGAGVAVGRIVATAIVFGEFLEAGGKDELQGIQLAGQEVTEAVVPAVGGHDGGDS